MDKFTTQYLATMLWSSTDGDTPLDRDHDVEDVDPESLEKAVADCARFQAENAADLEEFDLETAGHDFWLTRCGHGAGFWDGDYPEPQASRLTASSHAFGEAWPYVAGGKIHL